mmetsp:Transcript_32232/g.69661  ORF Transcript_32232/g.69661 Transcript_32232/m.69661 type:complete len:82 (-) Transcript_32232:578-823(-)
MSSERQKVLKVFTLGKNRSVMKSKGSSQSLHFEAQWKVEISDEISQFVSFRSSGLKKRVLTLWVPQNPISWSPSASFAVTF